MQLDINTGIEGILLIDKPKGWTSFRLVHLLRKIFNIKKIGHAGTLDPFATGVMVMLVGRNYTRLSDTFLLSNKEYIAEIHLGITTDTFDHEGKVLAQSSSIPTEQEIFEVLKEFQGEVKQIPPMFSAKKQGGKKLYELARKGIDIPRKAVTVFIETHFVSYEYPYLVLKVACSKGTYVRSIGHDIGSKLGCGAHLSNLRRIRSGQFKIEECIDANDINFDLANKNLKKY